MGLYFRKSVNLGGGLRLNFSKNGVGLSGGIKGLRLGVGPSGVNLYGGIPGTGLYYRKKLSGLGRNSNTRHEYQETVTNPNTGTTRTLLADSQWELDSQVRAERMRQQTEELRNQQLRESQNGNELAERMTRQIQENRNQYMQVVESTLRIDDKLDWEAQMISEEYPSFEEKMDEYGLEEQEALKRYLSEKMQFDKNKVEHNADIAYLKECYENGDKSAVEKFASIIVGDSIYPDGLEIDYDFEYFRGERLLVVNCLLPLIDSFPIVEEYRYDNATMEVTEKLLDDITMNEFYENTLFAISLRTVHELFEATEEYLVKEIMFNAHLPRLGSDMDIEYEDEEDFNDVTRCIFSFRVLCSDFEKINITTKDAKRIVAPFNFKRVDKFQQDEESLAICRVE